jgi:glycosyltransferase involved in cell wall biosynthesis
MRVLVVTSAIDRSEAAVFRAMAEAGIRMDMLCDEAAAAQDSLREAGVTIEHLTARHRFDRHAIRGVREKLATGPYDIVYAPRNRGLSVSLLAGRGSPVKTIAYRGTMGHLSRLDPASWFTYLNPRVNRILCVSDAVRHYLLGMGIPGDRLTTIYKGHDTAWYAGGPPPDLAEFGIGPGAFVVGFTGNIRPVKGVDVLLRALARVPPPLGVHVLLVGEVRDRRIRRLASDPAIRAAVHLAGFRRNAAALAGACDAFVMPSVSREGLPRAVIEAMAQGVPPIVSDVGGMPELVVDGECGLVVPPRDPDALAQAIGTLAGNRDRAGTIGRKAQDRIRTHFNIETTIARTLEVFDEVAGRPRGAQAPRIPSR